MSSPFKSGRWFAFLLLFALALFADQLLKSWVVHSIPPIESSPYLYPYGGIPLFRDFLGIEFSLNYVTNRGAAWGLFSNHPTALLLFRLLLIAALLYIPLFREREPLKRFAFCLVVAGAIGNILDTLTRNHVVDMFHFVFWGFDFAVFNLADSYVTLGAIILCYAMVRPSLNAEEALK